MWNPGLLLVTEYFHTVVLLLLLYVIVFSNFGNPKLRLLIQACFALFTNTKHVNIWLTHVSSSKQLFLVSRALSLCL